MNDTFKSRCRRRCAPSRQNAAPFGAGSGGGPGNGNRTEYISGQRYLSANQTRITSMDSNMGTGEHLHQRPLTVISALSENGETGAVYVRGDQGVRVSSGEPSLSLSGEDLNGVQISVGESRDIQIHRGEDENESQAIYLFPEGITIDASIGYVDIMSNDSIRLAVAGGASSITLTPAGIVLKGPMIYIN